MSKDISKLKNKRTMVRPMLTKLINEIEGTINCESRKSDSFEVFLEQLSEKDSNLNTLNKEIEDLLTVETISEDMEASEEIKAKIIF
ncbi:hypothetical protein NPIL_207941 [Nephila pilipes]|uniref:Uncharacterized protein n=1 Tax=Nephila pilipes TaxID=299642 RepID=A0A8X6TAS2_NEPPI|nr:hypothetical protein NPIL_207941 [Nephila pilipes]